MQIYFILDRSGSMQTIWGDALGSFNAYVADQAQDNPDDTLTLILFDDQYEVVFEKQRLADIEELTAKKYTPRGSTALLDAIGKTISPVTEPSVVVIMTDGFENSSVEYGRTVIQDLIQDKEAKGWSFIYLGADQDSFNEATNLGITATVHNVANYTKSADGLLQASLDVSRTTNYARTQKTR